MTPNNEQVALDINSVSGSAISASVLLALAAVVEKNVSRTPNELALHSM